MTTPASPIASPLKKTALNATHRALKAKMVDFGGWDMPVEYPGPGGGLIAEHLAVRTGVGLFDVSHMGEIRFLGPGTLDAIEQITMNDARRLKDGQVQYSALLTPEGTFVDDILVHRLSENEYLLVVNASNKDKDFSWIQAHVASLPAVRISDESSRYSQLALQGPRAQETLQKLTKTELAPIRNYWFTWGEVAGVPDVLITRTGYSGEDGFELYLPSEGSATVQVWRELLAANPLALEPIYVDRASPASLRAAARQLRAAVYDFAIDFQGLIQSALVTRVARRAAAYGFHRSLAREWPAAFFYNHALRTAEPHVVDRNMALAVAAGAAPGPAEFPLPPGRPEGQLPERFVLAAPLAGWASKQWPLEYYAPLARRLREHFDLPLVLNGAPSSEPVLRTVAGAQVHISSLSGLIDATRRATAVLGLDSGPMHLAADRAPRRCREDHLHARFGPRPSAARPLARHRL